MQANYIIGIFGKKGSGKSTFLQKMMVQLDRYICVDPHSEHKGIVCGNWKEVMFVLENFLEQKFRIVYRPDDDNDMEEFFKIITAGDEDEKGNFRGMQNFTLIMDEADLWCSANYVHPAMFDYISYGRKRGRNLIYVSRRPPAISRFYTSQSDVMISFLQTEPNDLKYFSNYTFNKDLQTLKEYEWAYNGDGQILTEVFHLKNEVINITVKGGDKSIK